MLGSTQPLYKLPSWSLNMTTSPEKEYLSQSHQPQLYSVYGSTYALAVIAVGLRLSARKYFSKAGIWWDDYAICASLACASGNFVDMIICKKIKMLAIQ